MNELKKQTLETFWSIYDTDGAIQALSWLESLKYYEEYCKDDITSLIEKTQNIKLNH